MYCGGGFGRRGEGELDWVQEAAEIAKHLTVPVQVIYTREDDTQHDYYRPASYVDFAGGLNAEGWPVALSARIACSSFGLLRDGVDFTAVVGLSDLSYQIPDLLVDYQSPRPSFRFPTGARRASIKTAFSPRVFWTSWRPPEERTRSRCGAAYRVSCSKWVRRLVPRNVPVQLERRT